MPERHLSPDRHVSKDERAALRTAPTPKFRAQLRERMHVEIQSNGRTSPRRFAFRLHGLTVLGMAAAMLVLAMWPRPTPMTMGTIAEQASAPTHSRSAPTGFDGLGGMSGMNQSTRSLSGIEHGSMAMITDIDSPRSGIVANSASEPPGKESGVAGMTWSVGAKGSDEPNRHGVNFGSSRS